MERTETTTGETTRHDSISWDQRALADHVREQPLLALGIAALAGFVVGGGAWTRTGMAGLMLAGRIAARQMAVSAIAKAVKELNRVNGLLIMRGMARRAWLISTPFLPGMRISRSGHAKTATRF